MKNGGSFHCFLYVYQRVVIVPSSFDHIPSWMISGIHKLASIGCFGRWGIFSAARHVLLSHVVGRRKRDDPLNFWQPFGANGMHK
jgi:hypothetical protein